MNRIKTLVKGTICKSPYGDDHEIVIMNNTKHGICFKHPVKGVCGMRWDSMSDEEHSILFYSKH